jgi:hypothetical protein
VEAYVALLDELKAHYVITKGAAPWAGIAATIGELTERQANLLAARAGQKEAAGKKSTESEASGG